jgi:His/Glu/Gln/Arg/opine family amino acid ABC transporter permease subunit
MDIWEIIVNYRQAFASGLLVSFKLAALIWSIGILIGSPLGVLSAKMPKILGRTISVFGAVITAIPALVLMFWLHYPLQAALKIVINPFYTAVAALSFVNVFGVASLLRSSIIDFPSQYITAAKVCGLNRKTIFIKIVMPLIIRQILPGLLILQVTMLQATLFASLISVEEIFRVAQRINSIIYKPIEIYTALAFLFVLLCLPLNILSHVLQKKYKTITSDQ